MKPVIVLGDLNLDVILSGMPDHPSFGKEILADRHVMKAGGSAANVAIMLAAGGHLVRLFSRIGKDPEGMYVLKDLEKRGLNVETIALSEHESTGITVSLTYPRDRMYVSHPGTVASTKRDDLPAGYLCPGTHLHLSSYFLQSQLQPFIGELLKDAKAVGMSTSLDPGGDPTERWDIRSLQPYLTCLDWFLPNAEEIKGITRTQDLEQAILAFPREAAGVVVKNGSHGAIVRHQDKMEYHPGSAVQAIDTTCAGDCFDAGFLKGLIRGASIAEAIQLGNHYGAQAVSCLGLPAQTKT